MDDQNISPNLENYFENKFIPNFLNFFEAMPNHELNKSKNISLKKFAALFQQKSNLDQTLTDVLKFTVL